MKAELPQFTGLRGIAALLVLMLHIRTPVGHELYFGWLDPFSMFGFIGVDLFFVLSGFILSYVYRERFATSLSLTELREFAVARFARLYPLHLATTLLMLIAFAIAVRAGVPPHETGGYTLTSTILSLFLIQEWFGVVAPNAGSWSISIELLNYLIFPLIIAVTARLPKWWPLLALVAGTYVSEQVTETNVPHGVAEFIMGCAAYSASQNYRPKFPLPFSIVFFVVPFLILYQTHRPGFAIPAFCFTLLVYFMAVSDVRSDPFARLCATRPLVFIGEISYSIYLLQWFVWIGWKHVIAKLPIFANNPYLMVACASMSLIIVSIFSYYLLEKPCRLWLRQRLMRSGNAVRAATTA